MKSSTATLTSEAQAAKGNLRGIDFNDLLVPESARAAWLRDTLERNCETEGRVVLATGRRSI